MKKQAYGRKRHGQRSDLAGSRGRRMADRQKEKPSHMGAKP